MDFATIEQDEGVRFVWNNLPKSKIDALKNVLPISMFYTPFFQREEPIERLQNTPLICQKCQWIVSPYSPIDYTLLKYDCPNCSTRQSLSSYHQNIVANGYTLPEFEGKNTVIEYVLEENDQKIPFLIFVLDTCLLENEFYAMKNNLINEIEQLGTVYIALITVSHHVSLHDLSSPFLRETIINGKKEYTQEKLLEHLGLKQGIQGNSHPNKYIQPFEDCKERVLKILKKLKPSRFEIKKTERAIRASGQALAVSIAISSSFGGNGGRVIGILGGPCTIGPGMIITEELSDIYRNHNDIEENSDAILRYQNAKKFYESLISVANNSGVTIDLFVFCLTQFGLGEMRNLIQKTGGIVINEEEFSSESNVYQKCLNRYMQQITNENSVYNAQMTVQCSNDLYLSGMLGPGQLVEKSKDFPKDAENTFGESGGNKFQINSPISSSTYQFFYSFRVPSIQVNQKPCFFQVKTVFTTMSGKQIMRVSTFMREFVNDDKLILQCFDQEAAIAQISRLSAYKGETIQVVDLVYWLNSILIKFVRRFSQFQPNKENSIWIPDQISLLPQFMFYFRKSYFIQKFGTSIDESAFYKMTLFRETLTNMLVMIQPALFSYSMEQQQPMPVQCELDQLKPDVILLVDTYFHVLIWEGATIHSWIEKEYHLMDEYAHLKSFLEKPQEDVNLIVEDRLPHPKIESCFPGAPMERLLKSKLNPTTDNSNFGGENENYITDDVSLKKFMDYLIKLVVKQQ